MLEVLSIRACTESFTTFKDRLREVLKARDGCGERKDGKPQAGTPLERSEGSSSGEEGKDGKEGNALFPARLSQ